MKNNEPLIYPPEPSSMLRHVLGFTPEITHPMADVYRKAGVDVPLDPEGEHAYILDRMIKLVLKLEAGFPGGTVESTAELARHIMAPASTTQH